jgi:mono/diheme cytochrome c family protein
MKLGTWVNALLFLVFVCTTALCWLVPDRDVRLPNYEFLPEAQMAESPAYGSFAPNPNFADGLTLRTPPAGTIARGHPRLDYQPTLQDALRAGLELPNSFRPTDTARRDRGTTVFTNFCQVCHGPLGQGNGPVTQGSFPPPSSLLADRAIQMKDGHLFHVLTYGQGNMPSFAAQLSRDDRWSVILHIRMLQGPAPTRSQEIAKLFGQNCAACHGADGTGTSVRKILPVIPDFTSLAWQLSQTEMAIVNQIDYGSAPMMPSFRYKLTREQVLGLAVYIRSFAAHHSGGQPSAAPPSHLTAKNIYGTFCFTCHDTNGKGNAAIKVSMPDLPDFTARTWQATRKNADLEHSILDGKGKFMLPMKDKLGTVDVKDMVVLVRGFDGGKQIIELESPKAFGPPPPVEPTTRVDIIPLPPGTEPKNPPPLVAMSGEDAARIRIGATIFRQYCFVCHGNDGKGLLMRPTMPQIPDFTSETFHKEHNDAQIRVSILEGKGTLMPANRGRVTEEQAGDLVAYIRAFGPKSLNVRPGTSDAEFENAYRTLELQLNELHKQLHPPKGKP